MARRASPTRSPIAHVSHFLDDSGGRRHLLLEGGAELSRLCRPFARLAIDEKRLRAELGLQVDDQVAGQVDIEDRFVLFRSRAVNRRCASATTTGWPSSWTVVIGLSGPGSAGFAARRMLASLSAATSTLTYRSILFNAGLPHQQASKIS